MGKRITVIITDLGFGGAQHMVFEQLNHTDKARYDVHVLCYGKKRNTPLEEKLEKMFPVTYLNEQGRVTPFTIIRVVRAIKKTNPDLVHAHLACAGFASIWAQLYKKPLVITVHTKPAKAFSAKNEKQVRRALKAGKTRLVAVSEDNATAVREYFALNEKQCACVNNGIDLDRFSRKDHDGFTIIHVGRQDENKNQAVLIRCFARLHEKDPATKLLLLGDGVLHQTLAKQVEELGLTEAVVMTGNVANTEDYYAVSDLYVQCSHREAMPLSVLEAMATGLPIVSTDVGGLSDVVLDNGILVADNDEEALYRAIEKIHDQTTDETEAMCRASDRIVQAYSSAGMAKAYEKIYDEMHK